MNHQGTKKIETQRLILRRFVMDDASDMYRNWASDEEVTRYLTWPPHSDISVSKMVLSEWLENYSRKDYYQWAVTIKGNESHVIGCIGVNSCDDRIGKAHIGYCIGRAWWHQGITSEALQAVIDFLFDEVGMRRIESRHAPENPRSGQVMRKCGMHYEGTLRQSDWNNQGICDACWYALLSDERAGRPE